MDYFFKRSAFLILVGTIGLAFVVLATSPALAATKATKLPYANGVLLKSKTTKKIYLIKDNKKQYIGSLADLKKLGKKRTHVVTDKVLAIYANYSNLVKAESANIKEAKAFFERYKQLNQTKDCTSSKEFFSKNITKKTADMFNSLVKAFGGIAMSLPSLMTNALVGTSTTNTPNVTFYNLDSSNASTTMASSTFANDINNFDITNASSMTGGSCKFYKDIALIKAEEKYGGVLILYNQTHANGLPEESELFLLKENGSWKMAEAELLSKRDAEKRQPIVGESADGLPDFVVTKAELYPNPGKVNSDDTELKITIKNIGNKTYRSIGCSSTSTTLLSIAADVIGSKYIPASTQSATEIVPGGSDSVTLSLFDQTWNEHFPDSRKVDQPGKKTIKITLNGYNDIKESNTKNNIFTQEFNFVR